MRIISGSKKGHKLKAPKGRKIRPTEDRIKESLFNIIGSIDRQTVILDLFAGSGSIGIEFLSRGAEKAFFVDRAYESIQCIDKNLTHTKLRDRAEIIKGDAFKILGLLSQKDISFNYIFIDPPYKRNLILGIVKKIWESDILAQEGQIIIEHESELSLGDTIGDFVKIDYRNYGNKSLSFFT